MAISRLRGGLSLKVLVVYDVPVEYNAKREKLREHLKNYGGVFRQYSVYEVDLERRKLEELIEEISKIIRGVPCKVEIVMPCKKCYESIRQVGGTKEREW